jgi:Aldehyde dehydrogenase family
MEAIRRYSMFIGGDWGDSQDWFGVWSTDSQRALDMAGQLQAGTVWINDWHMVNAAYPSGGCKQSGLGRELGPHALDEYTEEKFVHVDESGRLDRRAYALLLSTPPS